MDIIKRIIGALLVIHGFACGLFYIIEHPFHYVSGMDVVGVGYQEHAQVWLYLNPATAVGIALALLFTLLRKIAMQRDGSAGTGITRAYLETNVLFYGFLIVAIWFYRLWFGELTGDGLIPVAYEGSIVYALYPLMSVAFGIALTRGR